MNISTRPFRTALLTLATLACLSAPTGCDLYTQADTQAQTSDDEFRLIFITYFGMFTVYVNVDDCDTYWDALGPELAADAQEIATCTQGMTVNPNSPGVIIDVDPHFELTADAGWTLTDGQGGVTTIPNLTEDEPCAASDPELCPWLLVAAGAVREMGPVLLEGSPSGEGGLAMARMSAEGLRLLPELPSEDHVAFALVAAVKYEAALVAEPIDIGNFDPKRAVDVAVTVGPNGSTSIVHEQVSIATVPHG